MLPGCRPRPNGRFEVAHRLKRLMGADGSSRSSAFAWHSGIALVALCCSLACGRNNADTPKDAGLVEQVPPRAETDSLWREAESLEVSELTHLASREGVEGLLEGASAEPRRTRVALAALAYCPELRSLPFLVKAMREGGDNARTAAESVHTLASRGARAYDPEDALEFREGCDLLVAFAADKSSSVALRTLAIDSLRMFATLGCPKPERIPTDLDPKE